MEIILIRHAKTEEKREDLNDIRRNLKEKGKKQIEESIPELKEKLGSTADRKLVLWSSPAVRAFETSHIVSEGLGIDIDAIKYFIYEGSFEDFSQEIQNLEDETTLLVVGHEPYLSEWTKHMSDEEVEIGTGDMLSFKVTRKSPVEAELQWVISSD